MSRSGSGDALLRPRPLRLLEDESLTEDQQYDYLSELLKVATDRAARVRTQGTEAPVLSNECTPVLARTLRSDSVKVRTLSVKLV